MKDLHNHLLYGIDDGSKSIDESIDLLKKMSEAGISEIVLTPHYIENSKYNANNRKKKRILTELKKRVKKENINISLYLGNEAFVASNFIDLLDRGEISTINNSKYILFEFPMRNHFRGSTDAIIDLVKNGYIPILAHPERYICFQENPDLIEKYLSMGVLMQGNYTSLFGKYGRHCKKLLKYYIKKGYISFLGSDTHHDFNYSKKDMMKLEKLLHKLSKDEKYISDMIEGNFDKVINKKEISMIRI